MTQHDRASVHYEKGIIVTDSNAQVKLDPGKKSKNSVVTHAHMDHLVKGSLMTHQTKDIMEVRLNSTDARGIGYNEETVYGGFDLVLKEAGHCLGSAMVHLKGPDTDLLYTGDINPHGGLTIPPPKPQRCRTLVIEATYGKHFLPPKGQVTKDLIAWCKSEIERSTIVFGAYEFGKAQEIIAAVGELGYPVYTTDRISRICDVYRKHGVVLKYETLEETGPRDKSFLVLPGHHLKAPNDTMVRRLRKEGARVAYVSGWCNVYDFTRSRGIDAQFPISDHGDLPSLLKFIEACSPEEVLTVYGSPGPLALSVEKELGIPAVSLEPKRG